MIPFSVTFIACLLLGLEYGIVIGIATNLLFILYNTARPDLQWECVTVGSGHQVILVTPNQSLFFSAAEYVKYKILKLVASVPHATMVVLNGHYVPYMDATVAENLKTLVDDCALLNMPIVFWNWQPQPKGVAIRLTTTLKALFKQTPTLDSLVDMVLAERTANAVTMPSE